jgi:hypothetical protein
MRDVIAGVIAALLLLAAASLATTLQAHRRRRRRAHEAQRALGRSVVAEIPSEGDLVLFSEDDRGFYCGDRTIAKSRIAGVRMLINGSPIAIYESPKRPRPALGARLEIAAAAQAPRDAGSTAEPGRRASAPDAGDSGLARDRWDVAIEIVPDDSISRETVVTVECGTIRDRVSQELARAVFEAVKRALEQREAAEPQSHTEGTSPQSH